MAVSLLGTAWIASGGMFMYAINSNEAPNLAQIWLQAGKGSSTQARFWLEWATPPRFQDICKTR